MVPVHLVVVLLLVGTILKSFLVASASCHLVFSIHHQTNVESAQIRSEDIFQSPEFDRPIFFLFKEILVEEECLFFCHWVRMIELSSWFNINPFSFKNM